MPTNRTYRMAVTMSRYWYNRYRSLDHWYLFWHKRARNEALMNARMWGAIAKHTHTNDGTGAELDAELDTELDAK